MSVLGMVADAEEPQAYDSSETVHWRDTLDAFVDGWDEDSADHPFITFEVESDPPHGTVEMESWGTYSYQPFGTLDADGNLEGDVEGTGVISQNGGRKRDGGHFAE